MDVWTPEQIEAWVKAMRRPKWEGSAKELAVRGCVNAFGPRRRRPARYRTVEPIGSGPDITTDVRAVFTRRICVRPYGHVGVCRGPRVSVWTGEIALVSTGPAPEEDARG